MRPQSAPTGSGCGDAPRGVRSICPKPDGHWKTITFMNLDATQGRYAVSLGFYLGKPLSQLSGMCKLLPDMQHARYAPTQLDSDLARRFVTGTDAADEIRRQQKF
jgi:hypothetical protein